MKEIELTKGYVALVDDEDYEWAMQWKWHAICVHGRVYAKRGCWLNGKYMGFFMHREILARKLGRPLLPHLKEQVDHIEGVGLDNRRSNLRLATFTQNMHNRRRYKSNTSGFKGVYWEKREKKWRARIKINKYRKHLGFFTDPVEAALAYDQAARELHGRFAWTNFKESV